MEMLTLLMLGAGALSILLLLILVVRIPPFVALLLVATGLALAAGVPVEQLTEAIEGGLGKTLGHIAVIIALGAMIGRMVELSGGAEALAGYMVRRFGQRRVPVAMMFTAFGVGIPVFFEVGVIMLMPLAYGLARSRGLRLVSLALPMCMVLLVVHALLPPHPGMVAVAGELGIDIGRMLMLGLPIAGLTSVAVFLASNVLTRRDFAISDDVAASLTNATSTVSNESPALPRARLVASLIALPIALIMLGTLASMLMPENAMGRSLLMFLGIPYVALMVGVLACAYLLGIRRGMPLATVSDVLGSAIPGVAMVILVTGAGGAFARVLVSTGIGGALAEALQSTGLPLLLLAFSVTLLLRAAQGPTTVALMTTAGIIAPLIVEASLSASQLALLGLAMGAGGMALSHVNDPGFWIVTRMLGLSVADGLRTWTPLTTVGGFVALILILLVWPWV
ncbi:transporter [Pseudomonas sp. PA15(2017)]|uniref:GntT/GntP/DsdX family permease n=1 Tax=Pseudomonas sp. PA15(2017) TaxID=1932111 RepID=UPI00095BB159|nr:gluconate:H+ symporter [Pseudomonas sp. PA15(2017)]OLU25882.1 transporter [Pseudomonas sp. PA15(2017)]